MTSIVPYSFHRSLEKPERQQPLEPGSLQGVHFTMPAESREWILGKIEGWFEDRDEVILVDTGTSSKQEMGFIILEWEEVEIDPLFLAILRDEELFEDFTVYLRSEEV